MSTTTVGRPPFSDSSPNQGDSLSRGARTSINDPFCILVWKFAVDQQDQEEFAGLCDTSRRRLKGEQPKCLFQRLTHKGGAFQIHVGLEDHYGVLAHISAFAETLKRLGAVSRYRGLEIHGAVEELLELKEPLKRFRPAFFECSSDALV